MQAYTVVVRIILVFLLDGESAEVRGAVRARRWIEGVDGRLVENDCPMPVYRQVSEHLGEGCHRRAYLERLNLNRSILSSEAVIRSTS